MKGRINVFLNDLLSRKGLFILLLIVSFLLFREAMWSFYNATVVDGIVSKIKSHWVVDILFLLLIVLTSVSAIHLIKTNKRLTNSFFFIALGLFLLFLYCRFLSARYLYENYTFLTSSKYIDYLFVFFGCLMLIKVRNWISNHRPPIYNNSPFLVDKPIALPSDDKFSRKTFAKKVAEKIQSKLTVENAGALAIGINGPWGSGKTSFMNMIKGNIDKNNRIVIDFNPWRSSSSSKIIEDFFELLISEIKPHDPSFSNKIAEYAKTLTKIDENIFTKSTQAVADFLFEDKNKNEAYESINTSIGKIKKQILIFVDDLDRLDKMEIIEVLRLIRNTANFHHVVYVVCYDTGYIQTAIKDFNDYNFKSFLEKIFQFEFTLPTYEHGVLRSEIKKLLATGLDEKFHTQIAQVVDSSAHYGINFTNELIRSYRDVIRFSNSLLFEIDTIKEEIFFYDFYLLQLIKLEFPKVYEALIEYRHIFFARDGKQALYRLKTETEAWADEDSLLYSRLFKNGDDQQKKENKGVTNFEKYLGDNKVVLSLSEYDTQLLIYLVNTLLLLKGSNGRNNDAELYKSFAYPSNFHKYFAFRLYEGDLSSKEFEEFRRTTFDAYKQKVLEWIDEGKYSVLLDRLEKVKDFSSVLEFENQVRTLFVIGQLQAKENNPYWIDYNLTLQVLQYPLNETQIRIYPTRMHYANFIRELFNGAPTPAIYESSIAARIIARNTQFVLTSEELEEITFSYFKDYVAESQSITSQFWQLYHNCVTTASADQEKNSTNPEATKIAKKEYKTRVTSCELGRFIQQVNPGSSFYALKEDEWSFVFETLEEFENWFSAAPNIDREGDCFKEFENFYRLIKSNDFSSIRFDFKFLKPIRWV
jgi:hypothetical protein